MGGTVFSLPYFLFIKIKYYIMKRFQNFICEYLFKGFNYIDEKMGWTVREKLEQHPYCGHGRTDYRGKFTAYVFTDLYYIRILEVGSLGCVWDDHSKIWTITWNKRYFG
jgi:hypothetical protein